MVTLAYTYHLIGRHVPVPLQLCPCRADARCPDPRQCLRVAASSASFDAGHVHGAVMGRWDKVGADLYAQGLASGAIEDIDD